jgi:hypothetical protein
VSPSRKIALVAGIFFALTFVHIPALLFYDPVINNTEFVLGDGDVTSVRVGALLELVVIVANVATAVTLFRVLRRQNEGIALGYVALRIFESTIIAVGALALLSIVTLRQDAAPGADAARLTDIAATLVAVHEWAFFYGPGLCAGFGNGLLLGYLMLRSGLVPRNMALLGVIGGPLSVLGLMFVLFGQWEQSDPTQLLFTVGEIAWEASLTVYLIVWGFRRTPITAEVDAAA